MRRSRRIAACSTRCAVGGRPLDVVELPMPVPQYLEDQRLPASYANFYIANGAVLVPVVRLPGRRCGVRNPRRLLPGPARRADRLPRADRRAWARCTASRSRCRPCRDVVMSDAESPPGLWPAARFPNLHAFDGRLSRLKVYAMGAISDFIRHHYRHFNGAALVDAADAYVKHLDARRPDARHARGRDEHGRARPVARRDDPPRQGARDLLHRREPRGGRLQPRRARSLRAHPELPRPLAASRKKSCSTGT